MNTTTHELGAQKDRLLANSADSVNEQNFLRTLSLLTEEAENAEMTEAMMKVSSISKFNFPFLSC